MFDWISAAPAPAPASTPSGEGGSHERVRRPDFSLEEDVDKKLQRPPPARSWLKRMFSWGSSSSSLPPSPKDDNSFAKRSGVSRKPAPAAQRPGRERRPSEEKMIDADSVSSSYRRMQTRKATRTSAESEAVHLPEREMSFKPGRRGPRAPEGASDVLES